MSPRRLSFLFVVLAVLLLAVGVRESVWWTIACGVWAGAAAAWLTTENA